MRKTTVTIIIIAAILVIGVIGYRYWKNQSQGPEELIGGQRDEHGCLIPAGYSWCEEKQKCLRVWEETCVDETEDWSVYKNEKFGFELKFPLTWDGYGVNEEDYPDYSYAGFSFKDGHRSFTIFQIIRYDKRQWESVGGENLPVKILHQSDDFVLVCDGCWQSDGDFTGGGQFDQFQIERCKEVPEIVKTFRYLEE